MNVEYPTVYQRSAVLQVTLLHYSHFGNVETLFYHVYFHKTAVSFICIGDSI